MRLHRDELGGRESERIPADRFEFFLRMGHEKDSARFGQVAQQHFVIRLRAANVIDDEDGWNQCLLSGLPKNFFDPTEQSLAGPRGPVAQDDHPEVVAIVSRWVACWNELL